MQRLKLHARQGRDPASSDCRETTEVALLQTAQFRRREEASGCCLLSGAFAVRSIATIDNSGVSIMLILPLERITNRRSSGEKVSPQHLVRVLQFKNE